MIELCGNLAHVTWNSEEMNFVDGTMAMGQPGKSFVVKMSKYLFRFIRLFKMLADRRPPLQAYPETLRKLLDRFWAFWEMRKIVAGSNAASLTEESERRSIRQSTRQSTRQSIGQGSQEEAVDPRRSNSTRVGQRSSGTRGPSTSSSSRSSVARLSMSSTGQSSRFSESDATFSGTETAGALALLAALQVGRPAFPVCN